MSRIAIIPIRSGSKGLIDKNIRILNGKPLVAYSIECALKSQQFDRVFVSTDSYQYAKISIKYGAEASFLRSNQTSSDASSSWDVVREVIDYFEEKGVFFDEIMLLQATSPLRTIDDIKGSIELFYNRNANAVQSVTVMEHSPLWANTLPEDGLMDDFFNTQYDSLPRQCLPQYYRENGAIYLIKRNILQKSNEEMLLKGCYAFIMPPERSIDIDTEFDFKIAELYLKEMGIQ